MADWVLVPCPGRRTHELLQLISDVQHPEDNICVVTTDPDPVSRQKEIKHLVHLNAELNYAKWLNAGIEYIAQIDTSARYVFITGSDTRCNASTLNKLVNGAEAHSLVMCGPDYCGRGTHVIDKSLSRQLHYRVPPEYFLLDLRSGLKLDEQFRWWYSEDDLEMQARSIGQVGLISDVYVAQFEEHTMNDTVESWAVEDRNKFKQKWGVEPW